ncbi:MAG: EamA family transporter [Desulfomicrobium sp.]|nr:EamA family transporter [Desulfomicrobium sp.]NLV96842.1 EamA family transporter [Desulfovibrionales bacterium]
MNHLVGIIFIAISAIAFGALPIFARFAYADGMDALTIIFLRFSLASVVMLTLLYRRGEKLPRGSVLLKLIGMGALGYVGQSFAYLTALKYATAGLVALLFYLYPMLVALLAAIFLKDTISRIKGLALILALLGTALTVGPVHGQMQGVLFAFIAALTYSTYIIVGSKVMQQASVLQSSAVIFISAGISAGTLAMINGPKFPATSMGWGAMIALAIVATIIAVLAFLDGLRRIGPTNAAMLSTLEPVVTVFLAYWCLQETLTPTSLLGGGLILIAVLVLTHGELRRPKRI